MTGIARVGRWAVELRDPSWLHDEVFEVLRRHDAALCLHDLLPDPRRLAPVAERLVGWLDEGTDVFAYFNDDYDGHAMADARWLRSQLVPAAAPLGTVG